MAKLFYKTRLFGVFVIFFLAFLVLITRLAWLQIFASPSLTSLGEDQHNIIIKLEPERGLIYDRNLRPLAMNMNLGSIYAEPFNIEDKNETAARLAKALAMDEESIWEKLGQDRGFVWIKRKVDYEILKKIEKMHLKGICILKEAKRFYPYKSLASHIIGFAGMDNVGLEGLEALFDGYLRGIPGWRWTVRDARARRISSEQYKLIPPYDGHNLVLAIDEVIQHIAERELDAVFKQSKAKGACVVVMDPFSGDVLALANRPSFDLNKFSKADAALRRNRSVTDIFEPGSVFKIVTASAALEEKAVDLSRTFYCEKGTYKVGNHILHDHTPHGRLTFREVIEQSSNIGTVKVAQLLGKEKVFKFIESFGFGNKTGIDLPGEVRGITRRPKDWSGISIGAIPIGQEVAVTPIQLATAMSAIANGGMLVKPRIIMEVRDKENGLVKGFESKAVRRVISESTSMLMKDILEGVVERGTGKKAKLSGYSACGKTGTGQKVEPGGIYSHSRFVASFAGFAPKKIPRVVILVCVDEPRGSYYGGTIAAPVFKNIAQDVLSYLEVKSSGELLAKQ